MKRIERVGLKPGPHLLKAFDIQDTGVEFGLFSQPAPPLGIKSLIIPDQMLARAR